MGSMVQLPLDFAVTHRRAGEREPVTAMHEAVEDGIGEGGLVRPVPPS